MKKAKPSGEGPSGPEKTESTRPTSARGSTPSLSRSQDNLASTLRKKAAAAALASRERLNSPKSVKFPPQQSTPLRNAVSTNDGIDKCGTPIKRAQSAQNISKGPGSVPRDRALQVKKSASTHNISNKGSGPVKSQSKDMTQSEIDLKAQNAQMLANHEKEKRELENRISELVQMTETRKSEMEKYKFEIKHLKEQIPSEDVVEELELLRNENKLLKEKLNEVGISVEHSTDSEKLSALQNGTHGDAAESETSLDREESAENMLSAGDFSYIDNSNWDKVSQKSGESELSVACLQDRISQMEESHYSTNEELQATLQELSDLQQAVNELSDDNERFNDERAVLMESLCAQTVKLENCRLQIDHLKTLLVTDASRGGPARSEVERQLVDMLKSVQEERDEVMAKQAFIAKQVELMTTLQELETANKEVREQNAELTAVCRSLRAQKESLKQDKKSLQKSVDVQKAQSVRDAAEVTRYRQQLDMERTRALEVSGTDSQDPLRAMLEATQKEKQLAEKRVTEVEEELAMVKSQMDDLKGKLSSSTSELQHLQSTNAGEMDVLRTTVAQKDSETHKLLHQLEQYRDRVAQLAMDCNKFQEENKNQQVKIRKLEAECHHLNLINEDLDKNSASLRERYVTEQQEWRQFQKDLQVAVAVANEFKLETQENLDKVQAEHSKYQDRAKQLEEELQHAQDEIKRLRSAATAAGPALGTSPTGGASVAAAAADSLRGKVLSTVDRELANLRPRGNSKDSLSVKNLIQSIEKQVKGTPPTSPSVSSALSSRRNSVDSIPEENSGAIFKTPPEHHHLHQRHHVRPHSVLYDSVSDDVKITSPLKTTTTAAHVVAQAAAEVLMENGGGSPKKTSSILKPAPRRNSVSNEDGVLGLRQDPLANLSKKMGGSKRNALLKWCQQKTACYNGIDITNFSSSWSDGLAFCALLHSYLPDKIPYTDLSSHTQELNFTLAFDAAESVNIPSILKVNDMVAMERPDWQSVMTYVTSIYKHFEHAPTTA